MQSFDSDEIQLKINKLESYLNDFKINVNDNTENELKQEHDENAKIIYTAMPDLDTNKSKPLNNTNYLVLQKFRKNKYNFPDDNSLSQFFNYYNMCNTPGCVLYFIEKQGRGLRLDFDMIFSSTNASQIAKTPYDFIDIDGIIHDVTVEISTTIDKLFGNSFKNTSFHAISSLNKKATIKLLDEKTCKLGIHQDYTIKLTKPEKLYLINLLQNKILPVNQTFVNIFKDNLKDQKDELNITISPKQAANYLDKMCVTNPSRFLGAVSFKSSNIEDVYQVRYIYEIKKSATNKLHQINVTNQYIGDSKVNFTYECSTTSDGMVFPKRELKINDPNLIAKYIKSPESERDNKEIFERHQYLREQSELNGLLFDEEIKLIKDCVMGLGIKYSTPWDYWKNTVASLVIIWYEGRRTGKYKDIHQRTFNGIAEEFSKLCKSKFKQTDFDNMWNQCLKSCESNTLSSRAGLGESWIKAELKKSDPATYYNLMSTSSINKLNDDIKINFVEGRLKDIHIANAIKHLVNVYYKPWKSDDGKTEEWYYFVHKETENTERGFLYKWKKFSKVPSHFIKEISEIVTQIGIKLTDDNARKVERIQFEIDKLSKELKGEEEQKIESGDGDAKKKLLRKKQNDLKRQFVILENIKRSFSAFVDTKKCIDIANSICLLLSNNNVRKQFKNNDLGTMCLGVNEGILRFDKFGKQPELITGYNDLMVTQTSFTDYKNPDPETTTFLLECLRSAFPDDQTDAFEYMMYLLSTGVNALDKPQFLVYIYGLGSNGKSTIVDLLRAVFGEDYIIMTDYRELHGDDDRKSGLGAQPFQMDLPGKRFNMIDEIPSKIKANSSAIKQSVGPVVKRARGLFRMPETLVLNYLTLAWVNHLPIIIDKDHGIWRRIRLIKMVMTFMEDSKYTIGPFNRPRDKRINDEFKRSEKTKTAFLNILIHYNRKFMRYFAGDFDAVPQPHIELYTKEYEFKQNTIFQFICNTLVEVTKREEKKTESKNSISATPSPMEPIGQAPVRMDLEKIAEIYIRWYKKKVGIECPDTITTVCEQMQKYPAIINRMTKESIGKGNTAKPIFYLKPEYKIIEDNKDMDSTTHTLVENINFDITAEKINEVAQEEVKKAINRKFDDLPEFANHIKAIAKERVEIINNTVKPETVKQFIERYKYEESLLNH
jgi:phage/plasmid-associated DNA primase